MHVTIVLDPNVPGKTASQQFHQLQLPFCLDTIQGQPQTVGGET